MAVLRGNLSAIIKNGTKLALMILNTGEKMSCLKLK